MPAVNALCHSRQPKVNNQPPPLHLWVCWGAAYFTKSSWPEKGVGTWSLQHSAGLQHHHCMSLRWWAQHAALFSCCTALLWVFSYIVMIKRKEFHTPSLQNGSRVFYPSSKETHWTLQAYSNITRWIFWAGAWAVADTSQSKASWQDFPWRDKQASSRADRTLQARAIAKNASNSCSTRRFSVFPARLTGMALLSYSCRTSTEASLVRLLNVRACCWSQRHTVHAWQLKISFCGCKSIPAGRCYWQ